MSDIQGKKIDFDSDSCHIVYKSTDVDSTATSMHMQHVVTTSNDHSSYTQQSNPMKTTIDHSLVKFDRNDHHLNNKNKSNSNNTSTVSKVCYFIYYVFSVFLFYIVYIV